MNARKIYLTKIAVAILVSFALTMVLASNSKATNRINDFDYADPYRVETFQIDAPGNLKVKTSGGHITVEGSSSNTVRVEMFVKKMGALYYHRTINSRIGILISRKAVTVIFML